MKSFFVNNVRASLLLPILFSTSALAGDWSLGLSAGVANSPYRETDPVAFPLPLVGYEGDILFFHGLKGGAHLWKDDVNQFDLFAAYDPRQFRPKDSDDLRMKRLDKRDSTALAGVEYTLRTHFGHFNASVAHDILDNSDGIIANAAYMYPIKLNDWEIRPKIGVRWDSEDQNKYYFGVSQSESGRSGLAAYQPGDSFTPYAELAVHYHVSESWNTFVSARYESLPDEVKNSPMVDKSGVGVVSAGFTYTF
ncbi:MipA/OmpV family protein [Affinibrenneria salicis]|uniref:MipA/OmpV family protein n=1 Tax=Affinibrenneria salicis TaxID=2590031 RepID=A0A5J5G3A9_9GAMM|nr:MipA/OmpV family protein [Affinibrenneria salicis]KAA9001349.1 MipA/OmpV family protein [Affinibrenneria salicis]